MRDLVFCRKLLLNICGSICALATPFTADGTLDLNAFAGLLDHQLQGGTQALVVAGSTGEAHMLEPDEFDRLLAFAVRHVAGRVPVLAGTGAAGTARTIEVTRRAAALGADAALVVVPYYVRPSQEGLRRHFTKVADQAQLPLLLYNVPSRTGSDLLPETVALLRDHPQIVGIKEAVSATARIHELVALARADFVYLSGDDGSGADAMLAGAAGTISVVANVVPQLFRRLCDAAIAGDQGATRQREAELAPLVASLQCAPNPVAVKAALAMLGLGRGAPRLPLIELDAGQGREQIRHALAQLVPLAVAA